MKSITIFTILLLVIYPAVTLYSPSIALELGYLSGAAYQSAASIEAWNCSYCHKYSVVDAKVFYNSVSGIQGFTAFSKSLNAVLVVFRGSNNIQNWILNIGTTRSTYPLCTGCSVHTGFLGGYNMVSSAVRTAVQNLKAKYRGSKLIITGHSLGGAIAILCTADLKSLLGTVDLTYTYGQPRVGNQAFAEWFQINHPTTFRLVDYADIVPHVPPSNLGFLHSNNQAWYQRGMQSYQICDAESSSCANSVGTSNFSTDDHSLDNYIKLKALTEQNSSFFERLFQKLQQSAQQIIGQNLRSNEVGSNEWKLQEQRKVQAQLQRLREEKKFKTQ